MGPTTIILSLASFADKKVGLTPTAKQISPISEPPHAVLELAEWPKKDGCTYRMV
jgi:hypothetical protein